MAGETTAGRGEESPELANLERLEALVRALLQRFEALRRENSELRERVARSEARLRELDSEALASRQTRREAVKRIDELVAQIEQVEADLERRYADPGSGPGDESESAPGGAPGGPED